MGVFGLLRGLSFEDAGYNLTKRQAWDGIRMVSGESGGEGHPKSAKWKNLCNLREVCFTKKSKPTTSIFEAEPAQQTKDPHEPIKKNALSGGVFLYLIVRLTIPKGLRPTLLATNG
jgi:hypothetical protein